MERKWKRERQEMRGCRSKSECRRDKRGQKRVDREREREKAKLDKERGEMKLEKTEKRWIGRKLVRRKGEKRKGERIQLVKVRVNESDSVREI